MATQCARHDTQRVCISVNGLASGSCQRSAKLEACMHPPGTLMVRHWSLGCIQKLSHCTRKAGIFLKQRPAEGNLGQRTKEDMSKHSDMDNFNKHMHQLDLEWKPRTIFLVIWVKNSKKKTSWQRSWHNIKSHNKLKNKGNYSTVYSPEFHPHSPPSGELIGFPA